MMAASKPTSPLSLGQDSLCYTEHTLRDLNFRLRCSDLATVPYAPTPTPDIYSRQVLSWNKFRSQKALQTSSVLYPTDKHAEAILRHNSTGTSHRRTRLAFHPIIVSHPRACAHHWFGPPFAFRQTSSCSQLDRPASGRIAVTNALSDSLSLRIRFLNLATTIHSLAHFSTRTLQHRNAVTIM